MWYQYIKIVVTHAFCQNSGITHPTIPHPSDDQSIAKTALFSPSKRMFSGWDSVWCVAAEAAVRINASEARRALARRAELANLNNLYGLIQPAGQRQLFGPRPA